MEKAWRDVVVHEMVGRDYEVYTVTHFFKTATVEYLVGYNYLRSEAGVSPLESVLIAPYAQVDEYDRDDPKTIDGLGRGEYALVWVETFGKYKMVTNCKQLKSLLEYRRRLGRNTGLRM